jgi:hypothetical protein
VWTPSVPQIAWGAPSTAMNSEATRLEASDLYGVLPPENGW